MKTYPRFLTAAEGDRSLITLEATAEVTLAAAGADGKPAGRPTFEMIAYSGGELNVGWGMPVYVDLEGMKAAEQITILMDHDQKQLVGQGTAEVSVRQCKVKGVITGDYEDKEDPAGKVVMHARNGFKWPCSIGAHPSGIEEVRARESVKINGRSVQGPAIVVRKSLLREVSFVSVGGDEKASAKVAASAAMKESAMKITFEMYLKACGKDIASLSDGEKAKLQASYDALEAAGVLEATYQKLVAEAPKAPEKAPEAPKAPEKIEASAVVELRAEAKRIATLNAKLAKHPDLLAKAIDEGWSEEKAELNAQLADLRKGRPQNVAPMIHAGGAQVEMNAQLCAAAMCLKHGIGVRDAGRSLIASYGEKAVNQADSLRRLRFSDMMRVLCAQAGVDLPLEVGTGEWIKAAFSGSAIGSGILGAVANKALAEVIAEPNWLAPRIAGVASHQNFHTHTVYSLAVNGDLAVIPASGEIPHLDLGSENWTRQVQTRGARLAITRPDLVNDDLGAFARMAQLLARKSMNAREKALFTAINVTGAGSTHFTSAHGNYLSGAALGNDAMSAAIKAFRNMTGPDGDPILVEPEILLVAPTNEELARRLLTQGGTLIASGLASTSSKTLEANPNIYGGRFGGQPMVGPYLENAALTGYSTTAFYLLANPAVLPCFEIAYLNGQQSPVIEYFGLETDPDVLGVSWRVYYDFGVGAAEWRGGVKHAGA